MDCPPHGDGRASRAYASTPPPPQPTSTGEPSAPSPGGAAPPAPCRREICLHPDPPAHRVSPPREAPTRSRRFDVPAKVQGETALLEESAAGAEARLGMGQLLAVRSLQVEVRREVDLVRQPAIVRQGGAEEAMAGRLLALDFLLAWAPAV